MPPLGERGPKGDHGQHGDEGRAGTSGSVGATGAAGAAGQTGATGAAGREGAPGAAGAPGAPCAIGPTGETGEQGVEGKRTEAIHPWRWRLMAVWIVLFTALVVFSIGGQRRLTEENQARIDDIQAARVASCERTYEGVREVFRPFFPEEPTPKQLENQTLFNNTVDELKANCAKQTRVEGGP